MRPPLLTLLGLGLCLGCLLPAACEAPTPPRTPPPRLVFSDAPPALPNPAIDTPPKILKTDEAAKATLLIQAGPSPILETALKELDARSPALWTRLALQRYHSRKSSGSGFVIAGTQAGGSRILTNAHVASPYWELSGRIPGQDKPLPLRLIHQDEANDIAVLATAEPLPGLVLAPEAPSFRAEIYAAGFPALGGKPSYQETVGNVSNPCVDFPQLAGTRTCLLQHTASVDPGSSGGPLIQKSDHTVVGMNAGIATGRHNVFLAVRFDAIHTAIAKATEIETAIAARKAPPGFDIACRNVVATIHLFAAMLKDTLQEAPQKRLSFFQLFRPHPLFLAAALKHSQPDPAGDVPALLMMNQFDYFMAFMATGERWAYLFDRGAALPQIGGVGCGDPPSLSFQNPGEPVGSVRLKDEQGRFFILSMAWTHAAWHILSMER